MSNIKKAIGGINGALYAPGFKYPGGKWTLRDWIMPYVPFNGSLFIEPFAGRSNRFLRFEFTDLEDTSNYLQR